MMSFCATKAQNINGVMKEAHYLTDKMAMALVLDSEQRDKVLQYNTSYLQSISNHNQLYGKTWRERNKKLQKALSSKQWKLYKNTSCFYKPIGWKGNGYIHNIYIVYPEMAPSSPLLKGRTKLFDNNSKEAIQMRKKMRKGIKVGAR